MCTVFYISRHPVLRDVENCQRRKGRPPYTHGCESLFTLACVAWYQVRKMLAAKGPRAGCQQARGAPQKFVSEVGSSITLA